MSILYRFDRFKFRRQLYAMCSFDAGGGPFLEILGKFLREPPERQRRSVKELRRTNSVALERCAAARGNPMKLWLGMLDLVEYLDGMAHGRGRKALQAAEALVLVATEIAECVKRLSLTKPELFRHLARDCDEWPSTISFHPDWRKENKEVIDKIELGFDSPLRRQPKLTKFATKGIGQIYRAVTHAYSFRILEIVEVVQSYYYYMEEHRPGWALELNNKPSRSAYRGARRTKKGKCHCPRADVAIRQAGELEFLSRENVKDWFEAGWQLVLVLTNGEPEMLPDLGQLGEKRRAHLEIASERTRLSDVRGGIKRELRKVFLRRFGR
jgi:hypothetical protein